MPKTEQLLIFVHCSFFAENGKINMATHGARFSLSTKS